MGLQFWTAGDTEDMTIFKRLAACFAVAAALGACAAPQDGQIIADPIEDVNRGFHFVNKGLDQAVLSPAADVYDTVTPTLFRHLFGNATSHLSLPGVFVNQILQGEGSAALETLGRFGVNTIAGAGGTLDPATEFGLPVQRTDFGVTLARWGVDEGVYIELPLLGPSTARDAVGTIVDMALQPTTYLTGGAEVTIISATATALEIVDGRSRAGEFIDELLYNSDDSYVSLRANYVQNRRRFVGGGVTDEDALPDLFE